MRLNQFDYFRAIAIILIVAGHTIHESMDISSFFDNLLVSLVGSSSALFVFISGFFFHHVFYKKFEYKNFMIKKAQNVLVPYFILTTLTLMLYLAILAQGVTTLDNTNIIFRQLTLSHSWSDVLNLYIWSLYMGKISAPYWYVPFIMLIFLLSPVFNAYIRLANNVRIQILVVSLLLAMVVHRPFYNLNPLQSVIYYLPIYLLGINYSLNRVQATEALNQKAPFMFLVVILLSCIHVKLSMEKSGFSYVEYMPTGPVDLLLLQKIFICFLLLAMLNKLQHVEVKLLKLISASSFAIYFLHFGLFKVMYKLDFFTVFDFAPPILKWIFTIFSVVFASVFIAYLIRLVLKEKSKYIVGW